MTKHSTVVPGVWLLSLLLLAAALIAAGGAYLWAERNQTVAEMAELNPSCDLQLRACTVEFDGGGAVELSVSPQPIRAAVPLSLTVKALGIEAESVQVDFSGEGMNMGHNRPKLGRSGDNGEFAGEGVLSICTTDRMFWRATVLLETDRGVLAAPYRFETTRS